MDKFEVIVVGAGPAGLAAAYTAAKAGLKTIILERGEYPGSKNMMGGVLYRQPTAEVFPNFSPQAPIERPVVEQNYWFLGHNSAAKVGYRGEDFAQEPYNSFTVLRAKFDRWLAGEVEKAGALLITETVVESLIQENNQVVGVRTGRSEGDLYGNVVIIAEGVNSILAQHTGLSGDLSPRHLAVAVKELHALPAEKIEDRFGLEKGQGAVIEIIGDPTQGVMGTGFIYTNKNSISVGIGAILEEVVERRWNPNDLLERMKKHPTLRPLLEGTELMEYLAHLIPEGGYKALPRLSAPGVMIVGDAGMLVNSLRREGSNLAMVSGQLAAQTAIEAHSKGDFSGATLAQYRTRLENSFVLQDLKKYQNVTTLFEDNPQFLGEYPQMVNDVMQEVFTVNSVAKQKQQRVILDKIKQHRGYGNLLVDFYKLWRVLG